MKFLLPLLLFTVPLLAQPLAFEAGQTVVFLGNSITHGGRYHAFVQQYHASRFPGRKVRFLNRGISGDTADGMLQRLDRAVLAEQPDYVFLMVGMNDVRRDLYRAGDVSADTLAQQRKALEDYYRNTTELAERLVAADVQPIFLTPSIYDQTGTQARENNPGVNDALGKCAAHIRNLAARFDAPLVDFYGRMNTINEIGQGADPDFTLVGADRIHPGAEGHFVMAAEIIGTLLRARLPSFAGLLAPAAGAVGIDRAKATQDSFLHASPFLPYYIADSLRERFLHQTPLPQDLNHYFLSAEVRRGTYDLLVNNQLLGTYDYRLLRRGVDLWANPQHPDWAQARRLAELVEDYREVQLQLRNLTYMETYYLRQYDVPDHWFHRLVLMNEIAEAARDKPWYNYYKGLVASYKRDKPREASLRRQLLVARAVIYAANEPEERVYRLVRR